MGTGPSRFVFGDVLSKRGTALGALAALLGYATTYLLRQDAIEASTVAPAGRFTAREAGPAAWQVAGWLWVGAHHVALRASKGTMVDGYELPVAPTATDPWASFLFVLPPVALTVAGALAAGSTDMPRNATRRGAGVVGGYLLAAAGSLYAFRWTGVYRFDGMHRVVVPEAVPTLLVLGVAFPVAFGALGGRLRHLTGR